MTKRSVSRVRAAGKAAASAAGRRLSAAGLRYMETSALLAALLEHDESALKSLRARGRYVTSALTFAEAGRAVVRARVAGRLSQEEERAALRALRTFARRCFIVDVTADILARVARPFPVEPTRTLDALHIATAEVLDDAPQLVTMVTRDQRVRDNATALGYVVE